MGHDLKVGDKLEAPSGAVFEATQVEGNFALVKGPTGWEDPMVFDDGFWRCYVGAPPWRVVPPPRWRRGRFEGHPVIYDRDRTGSDFAVSCYTDDDTDLDEDQVNEVAEAFVKLLNERFPA